MANTLRPRILWAEPGSAFAEAPKEEYPLVDAMGNFLLSPESRPYLAAGVTALAAAPYTGGLTLTGLALDVLAGAAGYTAGQMSGNIQQGQPLTNNLVPGLKENAMSDLRWGTGVPLGATALGKAAPVIGPAIGIITDFAKAAERAGAARWYSKAADVVQAMPTRMPAADFQRFIDGKIPLTEIRWLGLDQLTEGVVSKADVERIVAERTPRIQQNVRIKNADLVKATSKSRGREFKTFMVMDDFLHTRIGAFDTEEEARAMASQKPGRWSVIEREPSTLMDVGHDLAYRWRVTNRQVPVPQGTPGVNVPAQDVIDDSVPFLSTEGGPRWTGVGRGPTTFYIELPKAARRLDPEDVPGFPLRGYLVQENQFGRVDVYSVNEAGNATYEYTRRQRTDAQTEVEQNMADLVWQRLRPVEEANVNNLAPGVIHVGDTKYPLYSPKGGAPYEEYTFTLENRPSEVPIPFTTWAQGHGLTKYQDEVYGYSGLGPILPMNQDEVYAYMILRKEREGKALNEVEQHYIYAMPERKRQAVLRDGDELWSRYSNLVGQGRFESSKKFRQTHWPEADVLAHKRPTDIIDTDGIPVKKSTEYQSDLAAKGQKQGYAGEPPRVPDTTGWRVVRVPDPDAERILKGNAAVDATLPGRVKELEERVAEMRANLERAKLSFPDGYAPIEVFPHQLRMGDLQHIHPDDVEKILQWKREYGAGPGRFRAGGRDERMTVRGAVDSPLQGGMVWQYRKLLEDEEKALRSARKELKESRARAKERKNWRLDKPVLVDANGRLVFYGDWSKHGQITDEEFVAQVAKDKTKTPSVPRTPFPSQNDALEYMLKQNADIAAAEGKDGFGWDMADDISKAQSKEMLRHFDRFVVSERLDKHGIPVGEFEIRVYRGGDKIKEYESISQEKLGNYIGQKNADLVFARTPERKKLVAAKRSEKYISSPKEEYEFTKADIEVIGAHGSRTMYDKVARNLANDIFKKWGMKVDIGWTHQEQSFKRPPLKIEYNPQTKNYKVSKADTGEVVSGPTPDRSREWTEADLRAEGYRPYWRVKFTDSFIDHWKKKGMSIFGLVGAAGVGNALTTRRDQENRNALGGGM